jgi:single-stranded DNA-specific DHH superfamily exonuclease
MTNLRDAAELMVDPEVREDRRDRLMTEYCAKWAAGELDHHLDPEESSDLIRCIGELIALAMRVQHEHTAKQFEGTGDFEIRTLERWLRDRDEEITRLEDKLRSQYEQRNLQ